MSPVQHWRVLVDAPAKALDALVAETALPKGRIRHAMNCGAVWLTRKGSAQKRLRRATAGLKTGDIVDIYYDETILSRKPVPAVCVADRQRYSVWFKPAGVLTQGSRYGDHCSLSRQAEQHWDPPRAVFVVHRLDREAVGLVLLAHDRDAAARLSQLFAGHAIRKTYRVTAAGCVPEHGVITVPLDDKAAETHYQREHYDAETDTSVLQVSLITGRKHQIRRHLAGIGHAVLGDPRYGGRPCEHGLQLSAVALAFEDPFGQGPQEFRAQ